MKKLYFLFAMALMLAACGTKEKNWTDSYEKAKAHTIERMGVDQYEMEQAKRTQPNQVVNGDSVRIVRTYFNAVDTKAKDLKRFVVVVAEFDQLINARSYRDRLKEKEGFDSFLVFRNSDKKYCVCANGFDDLGMAAAYLKELPHTMKMKVLVPRAYILQKF